MTSQTIDGVSRDPCQWNDLQILDFLGLALRNVDVVGTVKLSEIRQGFEYMREKQTATQSQGDPVAWVECSPAWLKAGGDCANAPRLCVGRNGISHLHPAHAEQPASVADHLIERLAQRFPDLEKMYTAEVFADWLRAELSTK